MNNSGGTVGNGGNDPGSGGTVSNGGSVQSNGGSATGGSALGIGGAVSTGGAVSNGGSATGGQATGGAPNNGGAATGGKATGGAVSNGGSTATGGKATGGGGPLGGAATGGTVGNGGSTTGGSTAGGAVVGSCSRPVGTCSSATSTVTDVTLPSAATTFSEGDTSVFPIMIASMPSGGSRLAWLGSDKKNVHVAQLDCDDKITGTPFALPGIDLQDIIADDNGGVVLLTRDATNGGTDNCGTGTLCGGTSSPCRTMWMVRFNSSGTVEWETQVTNLSSSLAGYQNGARFVWWYQHHGRLAFSGTNYAAFFGVAITTTGSGSCVDIHQGDRLQIVSSSGALVASGSLAIGMSHAWTSRILWDPRSSKFQATDATDNNCRIANPAGAVTISAGACDNTLFNGDVVMASHGGYWNAWSQGNEIRLEHFTTGGSDKRVVGGTSQHPHLVALGANNMLLTWQSGTSTAAQVRSSGANAETVGSQFTIAVSDHDFGAWKAYGDGSAAYAAVSGTAAKIARVMPCN